MLIKEFRIPMPFSIDEYKIGQLYMIQKKSKLESEGAGSGVEIIENSPFENENERGQYTLKYYHVDQKLPQHLQSLTRLLFSKSALIFEEEGWNMYPYTRTRYRHKLFNKFSIEIETKFIEDIGDQENVFNLKKAELANRIVEYIDIVKDPVPPNEYNTDEDPKIFYSKKTNRGPLPENWYEELKDAQINKRKTDNYKYTLCAYKLCRIECNVWGFQTRIEKAISESIRKLLLMAHRQAWCWQDEFIDLTIDDIRRLEMQAQEYLNSKMKNEEGAVDSNSLNDTQSKTIQGSFESSTTQLHKNSTITDIKNKVDNQQINDHDDNKNEDNYDDLKSVYSAEEFYDALSVNSQFPSEEFEMKVCEPVKATSVDNDSPLHFSKRSTSVQGPNCDILILIVHGGNLLSLEESKQNDFQNIKATFDKIIKSNYKNINGRIAYRLVACDPICQEALNTLLSLSTIVQKPQSTQNLSEQFYLYENIPFNTLPLIMSADKAQYREKISSLIRDCNRIYNEFLYSYEGQKFSGEVVMIGDCMGSILAYDALCTQNVYFSNDSSTTQIPKETLFVLNDNIPLTPLSISSGGKNPLSQSLGKTVSTPKSLNLDIKNIFTTQKSSVSDFSFSHSPGGFHEDISDSNTEASVDNDGFPKSPSIFSHIANGSSSCSVSSVTSEKFEFNVSQFFTFGSPLGLVLAHRKLVKNKIERPNCKQIYNLFHTNDPAAIRIEPLLHAKFRCIEPFTVPRYIRRPYGDDWSTLLNDCILDNTSLFDSLIDNQNRSSLKNTFRTEDWWGEHRVDYVLYSPQTLTNLPRQTLTYLFHSSYWESSDVVSFMLRNILQNNDFIENKLDSDAQNSLNDSLSIPNEKWLNRLTTVKLRNLTPNHRANDVIVLEDKLQLIEAKFMYGSIDVALSGEKVDIFVVDTSNSKETLIATKITDKKGRIQHEISKENRLPQGMYKIRMIVRHDKSFVDFYLTVLPPSTEAVVFSIDGSFAANFTISGENPKVRPGSVDVVRHWQDLGYLIIYVSARPDKQKGTVIKWLAQHNFPLGMVYFCDGFSSEPLKRKAEILRKVVNDNQVVLKAAYGSSKDISVYCNLRLSSESIFIVGKTREKYSKKAIILKDGYGSHLSYLKQSLKNSCGNARLIIKRKAFTQQNSCYMHQSISTGSNGDRAILNGCNNSSNNAVSTMSSLKKTETLK